MHLQLSRRRRDVFLDGLRNIRKMMRTMIIEENQDRHQCPISVLAANNAKHFLRNRHLLHVSLGLARRLLRIFIWAQRNRSAPFKVQATAKARTPSSGERGRRHFVARCVQAAASAAAAEQTVDEIALGVMRRKAGRNGAV